METITITLPTKQAKVLKERAALYNVTPQEFVQQQIGEILDNAEKNNGAVETQCATGQTQTERMKAIIDDLMVRRHEVYVELAKGPEG